MEKGEIAIVVVQFVALALVVLLISTVTPGQTAEASPVISSTYWGSPGNGTPLHSGGLTTVSQNESIITASFKVAFSTQVSAITATRVCNGPGSSGGEADTYTNIPFNSTAGTLVLSPTSQQPGSTCTYTIKLTDSLLQTTTWYGSVELK